CGGDAAAGVLCVDADSPASLAAYALAGEEFFSASRQAADDAFRAATDAALAKAVDLLREVVGNPFRPVAIARSWRKGEVVAVAHSIYDSRRFEDLPVVADALEEAGCTIDDLLTPLRPGGPHV